MELGFLLCFKVNIATLGLEDNLILEDGPSVLIKSDLTNHPPAHPPTHPRWHGLLLSNQWSDQSQIEDLS